MLACAEMITMCLQSAKREHLRKQQALDHNQNHSTSLFQDVSKLWFVLYLTNHNDMARPPLWIKQRLPFILLFMNGS